MAHDFSDPTRSGSLGARDLARVCGLVSVMLGAGCGDQARAPVSAQESASESGAFRSRGTHGLLATGNERLSYRVRIDEALSQIDVELCPGGFRIEHLAAPSPGAEKLLVASQIITAEGAYSCPGEGVDLARLKAGECLRYAVNLLAQTPDPNGLRRVGRDRLASPDLWLWVPTPRPVGAPIRVQVTLPNGVIAALPWPVEGDEFALPETAFEWKAGGAFSHSAPISLPVPGGELEWAALGEGFEHAGDVRGWLADGARASSLLFGHFPVSHALVIGVPGERAGSSFGMALRGGGPAVVILLDRHASAESLASDWTCTHEFLHLGVPRLPPEDAWLFEGLATYYAELVRARAGLITPAQAYQHLLDGFARGRSNGGARTLRQESSAMRASHAFFRVYWAGAAIAFLTDLSARRAGGPTLDSALRSFAECCAASEEDWDAERVLARLDAELGAPRFADLARAWLDRSEFPAVGEALKELGVASGARGEAIFSNARDAALRDALMERGPPLSEPKPEGEPHQSK